MHFTVHDRDETLQKIVTIAKGHPDVIGMILVGSCANGGGDEYSDLDLSIVVNPDVDIKKVWDKVTAGVESTLKPKYFYRNTYGEGNYLTLFFLDNFLEIDMGVVSFELLTAKKPEWEVLFDRGGVKGKMQVSERERSSLNVDESNVSLDSQLVSIAYGTRNYLISLKRGNELRAAEELTDMRRNLLKYLGENLNLVVKHHRDINKFPENVKERIRGSFTLNEKGDLVYLKELTSIYFETLGKCEGGSRKLEEVKDYVNDMIDEFSG